MIRSDEHGRSKQERTKCIGTAKSTAGKRDDFFFADQGTGFKGI